MNIEQLYRDYSVPYQTEGHKHCRDGWVNTTCPFCTGNEGLHLGYNIDSNHYVCWRCGGHSINDTLTKLLNLPYKDIQAVLRQYGGAIIQRTTPKVKVQIHAFKLPSPLMDDFGIAHTRYLEKRGFDPDKIVEEWNLSAAGIYCKLGTLDFKHRIIIPIYWNGKLVNFQGRDITNKSEYKYLACPEDRELLNIKETLYGHQDKWNDFGIGVEGVTDVWRLGKFGVGLYGVKYKAKQVRAIAKQFKRFFILFDPDKAGQSKGRKLQDELRFRGVEAYNIALPDSRDPAELSEGEAKDLIKDLRTYKIK